MSRKFWIAPLVALAACAASALANPPGGLGFIEAERFATLPSDVRFPEGIAANPGTGDIFVATFDFGPTTNKLVRLDRSGHVSAVRDFGGTPLLGLEFAGGKVYILNFGASKLQRIAGDFDASTTIEDVATIPSLVPPSPGSRTEGNPDGSSDSITFGSNGFPAPNAMVFDHAGNLYISDSFQGAIFEVANAASCAHPCPVTTVSHDPLLATAGTPPFGANGLAFSADEKTMYVAVTGDHRVLAMDMGTKALSVFSISLHGADGLLFDNGLLWVATNQADHVVALNSDGRMVIKAGEFLGLGQDGAPRGLLFPASLVISNGFMYVTNLALPLTSDAAHPDAAVNRDEPEDFVKRWTVSRFRVPR